MAKGRELIRGLTGSKGTGPVVCKLRVITEESKSEEHVPEHLEGTEVGECLVAPIFSQTAWNKYLGMAAAIIADTGGPLAHGCKVCKSSNPKKPAVTSTFTTIQANGKTGVFATKVLKDGQMVVVEGDIGEIAREKNPGEVVREHLGAVYEYLPEKPPLSDVMAKYKEKYG